MNEITITVAGRTGLGTSTIARLIRNALQHAGLEVALEDDGDEIPARSLISRTDALIDNQTQLVVRTAQMKRQGNA
jgi:adenylylsulfate kinase-like enzyme